jgi:hypothetical protein
MDDEGRFASMNGHDDQREVSMEPVNGDVRILLFVFYLCELRSPCNFRFAFDCKQSSNADPTSLYINDVEHSANNRDLS